MFSEGSTFRSLTRLEWATWGCLRSQSNISRKSMIIMKNGFAVFRIKWGQSHWHSLIRGLWGKSEDWQLWLRSTKRRKRNHSSILTLSAQNTHAGGVLMMKLTSFSKASGWEVHLSRRTQYAYSTWLKTLKSVFGSLRASIQRCFPKRSTSKLIPQDRSKIMQFYFQTGSKASSKPGSKRVNFQSWIFVPTLRFLQLSFWQNFSLLYLRFHLLSNTQGHLTTPRHFQIDSQTILS